VTFPLQGRQAVDQLLEAVGLGERDAKKLILYGTTSAFQGVECTRHNPPIASPRVEAESRLLERE
jgi:hypothetical protein